MNNLPAHLQNGPTIPDMARSMLAKLGQPMPPRISIASNRFTLIDGAGNATPHDSLTLEVVIADTNDNQSKQYREDPKFNESDPTPPDCFSDNGTHASSLATKPQNREDGFRCVTCPQNRRGSAISATSGAQIKACRDEQKLAVMIPAAPASGLFLLTITPGSLGNFRAFLGHLTNHGKQLWMLKTELAFEKQGVLKFRASDYIDSSISPAIMKVASERLGAQIVGAHDQPITASASLPPPAGKPDGLLLGPTPDFLTGSTSQPATTPTLLPTPEPKKRAKKQETVVPAGPIDGDIFAPGAASTPASVETAEEAELREFRAFKAAQAAKATPAPTAASAPSSAPAPTATPVASPSSFGIEQPQAVDQQTKSFLDNIFADNLAV